MAGQTVTIKVKQWSVSIANTYSELLQGLSGVSGVPVGTGMLFDLGSDRSQIQINMLQMLFPLDIIFINSTQGVVGVMTNVLPGEKNVRFEATTTPGARCFLEVNAGEAEGIEVGDSVNIQGYAQPAQAIDMSAIMNLMIVMMVMVMMMKMVGGALKPSKERPGIPAGYVPVKGAKPLLAPPKPTKVSPQITRAEEKELQEKKRTLENTGRKIARKAGVKFLRLDEGWQPEYSTPRYWFKDAKGNEIIATDLKELKWKLSAITPEYLPEAKPKKTTAAFMEMAEWYCKYQRPMMVKELRPIATKYFGTEEELTEFYEYLATLEGQKEFRRELRDAMRRHSIPIPPEEEWLAMTQKLVPATGKKVYFVGSCKVSEGLCVTHGYSVSETVRCPVSLLTDEEWKAAFELVKTAFPEGQPNPWVNGWWPETLQEAEKTVKRYEEAMWGAYRKYEAMQRKAVEYYARSRDKAIYYYRHYVMREYERGKETALLPQTTSNPTRLDGLEIVKAYKLISRHGEDKISVSVEAWAIFPRGRRPHLISMYRSGDEYVINPLYAHISEWVHVPVTKVRAWIKSLPVRHFEPMAVAPEYREEAERLAREVDEPIAIIPLPSIARQAAVIPTQPSPPSPKQELEFVPDSPEYLAYTIEDIGYRGKLDTAFQTAIARAKGLR